MADIAQLPTLEKFKKETAKGKTALIILENTRGMQVALTNYGARIVSLLVPDKNGHATDVVLGFGSIDDYLTADEVYYGATIGRFANRINGGTFKINDIPCHITPNNGPNALHGGKEGFHQQIWDRRINNPNQIIFHYVSADGEEGFPGMLNVSISYVLTEENELHMQYRASTNKDTVINLTNHAYFNLKGEGKGDILDHYIEIYANAFVPINTEHIPQGGTSPVLNTPFDFNSEKQVSEEIKVGNQQLRNGGNGYDHCYVLNKDRCNGKAVVASAYSKQSGIKLEVLTTQPGVQFYTGNALTGKDIGKSGKPYHKYSAFCFETQHFPDSPNHPDFPSTVLRANETFVSETTYRFKILK